MRIVFIGDSLVYGYGVRREEKWSSLLSDALPDVEIINRGVSGNTTEEILRRFERAALQKHPDVIFFMGGSNDIFFSRDSGAAKENVEKIRILCAENGVKLILGIPTPVNEECLTKEWLSFAAGPEVQQKLAEYREWLLGYGKQHAVPVWDLWECISKRKVFYIDGIHLTPLGNRVLASWMEKKLIQQKNSWEGLNIKKCDI
ncbi:SGNH/GDSL hydrolase family protein [Hespellia stercorisuis]|uniref:Lysophospholipase L1 n=1 Tax=Hespellia stercorisuis DSM 15480 TaxID=1121950 RepID=A0A1M6J865_9FIRM|nr:GDSL-type esterase/lipase family protein [Hespellia stercorisuis]SHJ42827.1 Lysophospholipase L1 [Hespellia stercorisuis DSM 15480]